MRKIDYKTLLIILFILSAIPCFSQSHTIGIIIKNQPKIPIFLGLVKGDDFTVKDSAFAESELVRFTLPADSKIGIYRLIFGQTTYAKVMNEAPQQLDFIFNNEDIALKTDFKTPLDSLKIIQSVENKVWFAFFKKNKILKQHLSELEKEVNYYWSKNDSEDAIKKANDYNQLQIENDLFITQTAKKNEGLFAARLIKTFREPVLDGYLTELQRKDLFKKEYFKSLDFTDEMLINSQTYTDNVFKYLVSYNQKGLRQEQREQEYIKAVDIILGNTNKNEKVYEFILNYLVHGFEVLKLDNVLNYIAENYSGTTCQTDDFTTLERKLEEKKMKVGTRVADFTLNNINGDTITFSEALKNRNLILFWASWCPHCTKLIPQLKKWQKQAKNSNIEMFAISLDTSKEEWKKKVFEFGIESWNNLSDLKEWNGKVTIDYNVFATPTLFVIDKNLRIIGKAESFYELKKLDISQ